MTAYAKQIIRIIDAHGWTDVQPRWIEAWMRDEHGTLDSLSPSEFAREVATARDVALAAGADMSNLLAQSYGI